MGKVCYNGPMPIIGLTGNFGMGKTTVLDLFRKQGAETFDADRFVQDILDEPVIIQQLAARFGDSVLVRKGRKLSIDKQAVAEMVFADDKKRKALERIIHPRVLGLVRETASRIGTERPEALLVYEIPLLFEAGLQEHFDNTVVVYAKRDAALRRLKRKGFTRQEALLRLKAQMPITRKKDLADFVIDNSNGLASTKKQVERLFRRLRNSK